MYGSLRKAAKAEYIPWSTVKDWAKQRKEFGSSALWRTRPLSKKLDRSEKLSSIIYKKLVSPFRNPVWEQLYEAQIQYHNLGVTKQTLQYRLWKYTKNV